MNRPQSKSPPAGFPNSLLQVESELRRTLDEAGVGTWSWDLVTEKISLSHTCAELMGATTLDVQDTDVLQGLIHPEDRQRRAKAIQHAIERGGTYDIDYRVIRPDGQVSGCAHTASWKASLWTPAYRQRRRSQHRCTETGRRRTARQRGASAFDSGSVPEGMIVIDEHGIMVSFSPTAERLFGYLAEEVIGRNVNMLMPHPDQSRHNSYLRRYQETGEKRIIGIGRLVTGLRRNGSVFQWGSASAKSVPASASSILALSMTFLSNRRRRWIREIQAELVHMSRLTAMGEMASTLAHELNQPLAAISNYMKGCKRLLEQGDPHAMAQVADA